MPRYACVLGHQPQLSIAEIEAIFSLRNINARIVRVSQERYVFDTEGDIDVADLQNTLGGTKQFLRQIPDLSASPTDLAQYLDAAKTTGKITYSVSGKKGAKALALEAKKKLKAEGRSVRYVEPKNAATIVHNNLLDHGTDITAIDGGLWVTVAVQPFEDFKKRDYDRPAMDDKSGMLPPKLARMMVNLGGKGSFATIYDPFCGSGTTLVEALSLGYTSLVGSDISDRAVADSTKNTEWYVHEHGISANVSIFQHDISTPLENVASGSIDLVAAEPYMGKPLRGNETRDFLITQAKELAELYTKAFEQLKPVLAEDGTVIFIIPKFRHDGGWITIECLRNIKNLGYTLEPFTKKNTSLLYHREGQHVGRELWKFKKVS